MPPARYNMHNFHSNRSPSPTRPIVGLHQFPLLQVPYIAAISASRREDQELPMHNRSISTLSTSSSTIPVPPGWVTHIHPRGWLYYTNPTRKLVTDFKLEFKLGQDELNACLKEDEALEGAQLPDDCELWIDMGPKAPQRIYIDHQERTASLSPPKRRDRLRPHNRRWTLSEDHDTQTMERLELELRYFDFMRYHPCHRSLPEYAEDDAISALTWCCHNRLLYPEESVLPFSKAMSQELLTLLQSVVGSSTFISPRSEPIKVHFISDILKRIISERIKTHYSLQDARNVNYSLQAGRNYIKRRGAVEDSDAHLLFPIRAFWGLLMTLFCFGAPHAYLRYINEFFSGPDRNDTIVERWSTFVQENVTDWNNTNLVATVLIGAAVGFLAIPGIDGIARCLGLVSVLCAGSSIIIGLLNVWQHQHGSRAAADLTVIVDFFTQAEKGVHTYNLLAILLSLPLVLLIWATITFAAGIVTYAWLGVDTTILDAGGGGGGGGGGSQGSESLQAFKFGHPTAWVTTGMFVALMATAIGSFVFFYHVWTPPSSSRRHK